MDATDALLRYIGRCQKNILKRSSFGSFMLSGFN